ncbi:MAG: HAMP domain-containing sensor histidine kinase [Eubacteriales bacterium]|nr:HAMP domain-containing sensor histidine kinase [Eubacteriales bacterium]
MKKLKSIRTLVSLIVFIIVLATTLLSVGIYYIFVYLGLIPEGTIWSIWLPVIILAVCNLVGGIAHSIISLYFLKPLDNIINALEKFADGDFNVHLEINKRDTKHIRQLKEAVNKTALELESTETMRNDFINIISHEYKTPVASILGYAKILKNSSVSDKDKEEYTDIIIDESKRLSSMTNNILLLTKFENTEIIPDAKPYSLDEQLRSCVQLLSTGWLEKNIEIKGDLAPVTYVGNADLMEHIWINLLDNAIKHTENGGSISVFLSEDKKDITVKIQDTGCGIAQDDIPHVFDTFYQADKNRSAGGNGLGLSIVKRLTDLCKGTVSVESELGKGTTFTVTLPKR